MTCLCCPCVCVCVPQILLYCSGKLSQSKNASIRDLNVSPHTHTHTYIHTHIYIYTHTHTQTQMNIHAQPSVRTHSAAKGTCRMLACVELVLCPDITRRLTVSISWSW